MVGAVLAYRLAQSTEMPSIVEAHQVAVIDGDTIQMGAAVVQLYGIDAPELGQRCYTDYKWTHCGLEAAYELRKLIFVEHAPISCRSVAGAADPSAQVCHVGNMDFAHVLLIGGYVVTTPDAPEGYREAEVSAKAADLGLWHTQFIPPADWRAGERLPEENASEEPDCPIKAVIAEDGSRHYFVPTDDDYDSVHIDPARGGRAFCSDEEARDAGWRRPGEQAITD
jgi:endonuclease YncB( thermonuclease family)